MASFFFSCYLSDNCKKDMSYLSHGSGSCKVANTVYICSVFKCFYMFLQMGLIY